MTWIDKRAVMENTNSKFFHICDTFQAHGSYKLFENIYISKIVREFYEKHLETAFLFCFIDNLRESDEIFMILNKIF